MLQYKCFPAIMFDISNNTKICSSFHNEEVSQWPLLDLFFSSRNSRLNQTSLGMSTSFYFGSEVNDLKEGK